MQFSHFLLNSLTSIISSCAGYQNLSYKFAGFLFNVYCEISHSFLSLYFCFYTPNNFVQPIHSTYHLFPAFHNHFHQPNLPFCQHLFSTSFVNSFILFSQTFPQPATILTNFFFLFNHFTGFPCLHHPPPAIFFGKTFHFLCFH